MIIAVTGHPGSGKSFFVVNRAFQALKKGRIVFSNVHIKGCYKIQFQDLIDYDFPPGSLVIIDEAGRWFNSRNWKDLPSEVFDLFTLHRHFKLDLLVAVQNFNRIDVALREVIELTYWAESPFYLPYRVYWGYYDVEKVGGLKDWNVMSRVFKWTRSRRLYDTHEMENQRKGFDMPRIPWSDEMPLLTLYQDVKHFLLNFKKQKSS